MRQQTHRLRRRVLSKIKRGPPLRFRFQVGHAYTADALESETRDSMRMALRIVEERAAGSDGR